MLPPSGDLFDSGQAVPKKVTAADIACDVMRNVFGPGYRRQDFASMALAIRRSFQGQHPSNGGAPKTSISLSTNAGAYRSRPIFASHSVIGCVADKLMTPTRRATP
jgi:hypothetical protein